MNLAVVIASVSFLIAVALVLYVSLISGPAAQRRHARHRHELGRHPHNPVLSPQGHREWESQGAFNPGAVEDDDGTVHLFYRAIGADGISRVGHAESLDGSHISDRTPFPVYEPLPGYGMPEASEANLPHHHDLDAHPSGGGWGGAEDPRTVRIGDRVYMTFTAFEGWENMRIGLTSISMNDLRKGRWNWRRSMLISPRGARAKNWLLFPEKIRGKYAILHAIAPRVMVAYVDSPEMVPDIKSSKDHGGYGTVDKSRVGFWDERVKGAGTPPIKTSLGWLVLYHAVEDNRYKVGAMILDHDDPTKVLYRSPMPILSPDMHYENDGKPGVVYATGAVVKDGQLFIYYGGGDKHTCVAETPLAALLDWLVRYGTV